MGWGELALVAITILTWYLSQRDWPDAIPAVRVAEAKMRTIETARDGVTDSLKWLTDGIDQAQLSGDDDAGSLAEIVVQARELLTLAEDMPKRLNDLKSRQADYQRQMTGAASVHKGATTWRNYAAEASSGGIREMYVSLAKLWDSYASAIQASKDQPLDLSELEIALVYVE